MTKLDTYPNPIRLFTLIRDKWLLDLVEMQNIPIHIYFAFRNSNLSQFFIYDEIMKIKNARKNEESKTIITDELASIIPDFQLFSSFRKLITNKDINLNLNDVKDEILSNEAWNFFHENHITKYEWLEIEDPNRLEKIYLVSSKIIFDILLPLIGKQLQMSKTEKIIEKIEEIDPEFKKLFFEIFNFEIFNAILNDKWLLENNNYTLKINEKEEIISIDKFRTNTYKANIFVLELSRYLQNIDDYTVIYDDIGSIFIMEMITVSPIPDRSYQSTVSKHLNRFYKLKAYPKPFQNLLFSYYKMYCNLVEPNRKLLNKQYTNAQKEMRMYSEKFWNYIKNSLKLNDDKGIRKYEQLMAILWVSFRTIQGQIRQLLNSKETQVNIEEQSEMIMKRLERLFWNKGLSYLKHRPIHSAVHFWAIYTSSTTRDVRTINEAISLFNYLDELYSSNNVFSDNEFQSKMLINKYDLYILLQSILSYGIEARSAELYEKINSYVDILEKLLKELEKDTNNKYNINFKQEYEVINNIKKYIANDNN